MKKKILSATFVIVIITIATFNLYISKIEHNYSELKLADIELLAYAEDDTPYNPYCIEGGKGSIQCSIDAGIEILGVGVSASCSTSCKDGYYACCGIRCTCKPE